MIAGILGFQVTKPDYHPFDTFELLKQLSSESKQKLKNNGFSSMN